MKLYLLIILSFFTSLLTAQSREVELIKINDSSFIHLSYKNLNGYNVPSNGLIKVTSAGLVMVDTPWDDQMTEQLIQKCLERFRQDFVLAIITHSHDDRIGGIKTLLKHSIKTVSLELTCRKALSAGYPKPEEIKQIDTLIIAGATEIEYYYPGKGHSEDNTVVYFPKDKLLFAGCILKSGDSNSIGNTADADLKEWSVSVENISRKFSSAAIVIPGHGLPGGINLYRHTVDIINNAVK